MPRRAAGYRETIPTRTHRATCANCQWSCVGFYAQRQGREHSWAEPGHAVTLFETKTQVFYSPPPDGVPLRIVGTATDVAPY
jgi:hypothetical protein